MTPAQQSRIDEFVQTLGEEELSYLNRIAVSRLRVLDQSTAMRSMLRFSVGDQAEFIGPDGANIRGTIIRLNKKTVSLMTPDGQQWNVAPQFLK